MVEDIQVEAIPVLDIRVAAGEQADTQAVVKEAREARECQGGKWKTSLCR